MAKAPSAKKRDQAFLSALSLTASDWPIFKQWMDILEKTNKGQSIKSLNVPSEPQILKGLLASSIPNIHEANVNWLVPHKGESFLVQQMCDEDALKDILAPAGLNIEQAKTKILLMLADLFKNKKISPFDTVQVKSKALPAPSLLSAAIITNSFTAQLLTIEGLKNLTQARAVEAARAFYASATHGLKPGFIRLEPSKYSLDCMPAIFNKIDAAAISDPKELGEVLMALMDFKSNTQMLASSVPHFASEDKKRAELEKINQKFQQDVGPLLSTFKNIAPQMFDETFPSDVAFLMGATQRCEVIAEYLNDDARASLAAMLQHKMRDTSGVTLDRYKNYTVNDLIVDYPIDNPHFKMDKETSLWWLDQMQAKFLALVSINPRNLTTNVLFGNLMRRNNLQALSDEVQEYLAPIMENTRIQAQAMQEKYNVWREKRQAPFHRNPQEEEKLQQEFDQLQADFAATIVSMWSSAGFERQFQAPKIKKM